MVLDLPKKCFQNSRSDNQECDIRSETEKVSRYVNIPKFLHICHGLVEVRE